MTENNTEDKVRPFTQKVNEAMQMFRERSDTPLTLASTIGADKEEMMAIASLIVENPIEAMQWGIAVGYVIAKEDEKND